MKKKERKWQGRFLVMTKAKELIRRTDRVSGFDLDTPGCISFSGGRTSGYMLRQILDFYGGTLPKDVRVVFSNTGKEMNATLDFVRDCEVNWNVKIDWVEWHESKKFVMVNHNSASRNGEPYDKLITKRKFLPNPVTRYCTSELKIKVMKDFMLSIGHKYWVNYVGLRYDEPHRVARLSRAKDKERWDSEAPLHTEKKTVKDVAKFWENNSFDLKLPGINGKTPLGNCDLCFLKGKNTIMNIMKNYPEKAQWWMDQEKKQLGTKSKDGFKFRSDRPDYKTMLEISKSQLDLFDFDKSDDACFCHD